MGTENTGGSLPSSMRHRRILDVARQNPDASVDDLASMVPSATPDLVEHVFEEYGDPAAEAAPSDASTDEETDTADGGSDETDDGATETIDDSTTGESTTDTVSDGYPEPSDLSEKQGEVLAVVAAEPTATQEETGERVGVSRATVNKRVNGIEGFEWSERESFVDAVFDDPPAPSVTTDGGSATETPATDTRETAPPEAGADEQTPVRADIEDTLDALQKRSRPSKQPATTAKRQRSTIRTSSTRSFTPVWTPRRFRKTRNSGFCRRSWSEHREKYPLAPI